MRNKQAGQWVAGSIVTFLCAATPALAQITPDGTLGAERSIVTPSDRIEGGATRGVNLFHSFREFNVGELQRVYFANPAGISNILTRVTGSTRSEIRGLLGVDGGANLFLLNPNGILFGPNARLDIRGSFVASTASSFKFGDGSEFSATDPQAPPLLQVSVVPGLQYGVNQPGGTIVNRGTLVAGQDLTLQATNLDLQGQLEAARNVTLQATDTVQIRDSSTQPFVAQAGGSLMVQGDRSVDIFALNHPNSGLFSGGDMVLRSANAVIGDAHFWSGGNFRLEQLDKSLGSLYSPNDPIIRSAGDVSFTNYTGQSLQIFAGGSVLVYGTITITGVETIPGQYVNGTVLLSDGITPININANTQPTLDVRAGTTAYGCPGFSPCGLSGLPSPTALTVSGTPSTANILIANIYMAQPEGLILITNQYSPNTASGTIQVGAVRADSAVGNASSVVIDSRDDILLPSFGFIDSSSYSALGSGGNITLRAGNLFSATNHIITSGTNGTGKSGNIRISAKQVSLIGTGVSTITTGLGSSGEINVDATDSVEIIGVPDPDRFSGLFTNFSGNGNAGNLTINTRNFILRDRAIISTSTLKSGNGGNLELNASNSVDIYRGAIFADSRGAGNAGSLTINTRFLTLDNGAQVSTGTSNSGNGGNLKINSQRLNVLNGARLDSNTFGSGQGGNVVVNSDFIDIKNRGQILVGSDVSGNAGSLRINTKQLIIQSQGLIGTQTNGTGRGGDMLINASESVELIGANGNSPVTIIASTSSIGDAGNLSIDTKRLSVRDGAFIYLSANKGSKGRAGSLNIVASELVEIVGSNPEDRFPSGLLTEAAGSGNAGEVKIRTERLLIHNGGFITAQTVSSGQAGLLDIKVSESIQVSGNSHIENRPSILNVQTSGSGDGGKLKISTERLLIQDGAQIFAGTSGGGRAGNLTADVRDYLEVSGSSRDGKYVSSLFFNSSGSGNAGELTIDVRRLVIQNGGQIFATTSGTGQGGLIAVNASESVLVSGMASNGNASGLYFDSQGSGNARGIRVDTTQLTVRDGGRLTVSGSRGGNAGDLAINARSIFLSNQAQLTAITASSQGGNIRITGADTLSLFDRSLISASTDRGQGGTVSVVARDQVNLNNSRISAEATGNGSAGSVQITTGLLNVENGSQLSVNSSGLGNAGNLEIQARSVFMNDRTLLNARTRSGEGGNIQVNVADTLQLRRNSDIRTQADGTGNGGNISLTAGNFILGVLSEDSDVIASAVTGNGGNIFAKAEGIFGFRLYDKVETLESDFIASSQFGLDGIVDVQANNPRALPPLPNLTPPTRIDQGCQATGKTSTNTGRFADTGRGGMPLNPNQVLNRDALWSDRASPPSATTPPPAPESAIVEAQGLVTQPDGSLYLTAHTTPTQPPVLLTSHCNVR